jgi:hypothetical protein
MGESINDPPVSVKVNCFEPAQIALEHDRAPIEKFSLSFADCQQ